MSSETGFIPLRDLSLRITKGTTPTKEQGFTEKGINYIKSECITSDGNIDSSKFTYIGVETHQKLARSKLIEGNVLFSMAGIYLGKSAVVLSKHLPANTNQAVGIITLDPEKADPYFIHYAIQSPAVRSWVMRSAAQSAQPNFNLQEIGDLKIPALALQTQKEIAGVLRSLDDRIAILRETNVTLEAIAQALFKSWFVDFDPVHANAGTQAPSLPPEIQALFPATFTDSPQGPIPEGWTIGKVEDLLELAYGKALKATDRIVGEVPVYGSGGITGTHNQALVNGSSIIVGRKGTVGSLYWEDRSFFPIDTVFYVKTNKPLSYCFYLLQTLGLQDMNTDGAVPGLNRNNVYRLPVVIPSNAVFNAFDETAAAIREKIFTNNQQTQTLATLRDTLLPRLISGQLRLPEAEAALAEGRYE